MWSKFTVQFFNRPISDEPTKCLGIKQSTLQDILFDWSIYLSVLLMIKRLKMNESYKIQSAKKKKRIRCFRYFNTCTLNQNLSFTLY